MLNNEHKFVKENIISKQIYNDLSMQYNHIEYNYKMVGPLGA